MKKGYELASMYYFTDSYNIYQKEFGVKSYIKKSIIKLGNKIDDKIAKHRINRSIIANETSKLERNINNNENLEESLKRNLNKKILIVPGKSNSNTKLTKDAKTHYLNQVGENNSELRDSINNSDYIIHYNKHSGGYAALAHEIGHIEEETSKNPIKRYKAKLSGLDSVRGDFNRSDGKYGLEKDEVRDSFDDGKSGIFKGILRYVKGKGIIDNEKSATNNAKRLLKKAGASKEELDKADELLSKDLEAYKEDVGVYWKSPIRNRILGIKPTRKLPSKDKSNSSGISMANRTKERMKMLEERRKRILNNNKTSN